MLQGQTKEIARDFFQFLVSVDKKDHGEEYIRRVATAFIVTPFIHAVYWCTWFVLHLISGMMWKTNSI